MVSSPSNRVNQKQAKGRNNQWTNGSTALILFSFDLWRYLSGSGPSIIGMVKKRFRNKAQALADDLVREVIVENPKLTREGTDFLSKLFTNNQTTSSVTYLLLNVLQDENFTEATKIYAANLISHAIVADCTQNALQIFLADTLQDKAVSQESVKLINNLATSDAATTGTAKLMTEVMSRDTVLRNMTKLIVQGSQNALGDDEAHDKLISTF